MWSQTTKSKCVEDSKWLWISGLVKLVPWVLMKNYFSVVIFMMNVELQFGAFISHPSQLRKQQQTNNILGSKIIDSLCVKINAEKYCKTFLSSTDRSQEHETKI